ncbi:hypothetical protein ACRRTK_003858 [Alexandromys fortis]
MVLVLVVTLAVFLLYRWQQKNQLGTDIDGMDMSPHQKLEPPADRQSQSAPEDFQGLHLELGSQQEEDVPLQPPYYDLGVSPIYRPLNSSMRTPGPQNYAEKTSRKLRWDWGHVLRNVCHPPLAGLPGLCASPWHP